MLVVVQCQPPGRSAGAASSGHPVDGSAQVVEFPVVPLSLQGSSPSMPGRVLGHVCGTVRLGYINKKFRIATGRCQLPLSDASI